LNGDFDDCDNSEHMGN
jgi:hypothetical protein